MKLRDQEKRNVASVDTPNDFYKTSGDRCDLSHFGPSLTRQEFAEECDINTIMARYEDGGAISHVNRAEPIFLDTTLYPDLQGSLDAFKIATAQFAALPAKVRKEFDNDPEKFVQAATDPEYLDRFREWGLAKPVPTEEPPIRVEVMNKPPANDDAPGASKKPA